jgi:hypothetical protein
MPQTKTKKPAVKGKGSGLKKKVGPLPVYGWVAVVGGLILVYYLYARNKTASPATGATDVGLPLTQVTPQQAASAGTPSPNSPITGQLDPSVLASLGIQPAGDYVTSTDLQSQISGLSSDIGAAVANVTFPTPTVNVQVKAAPTAAAPAVATAAKKATNATTKARSAITYYTYRKNVKLSKGQTIHYAAKKGYYAA